MMMMVMMLGAVLGPRALFERSNRSPPSLPICLILGL